MSYAHNFRHVSTIIGSTLVISLSMFAHTVHTATPQVSSYSANAISTNYALTITGTNFGTKVSGNPKAYIYADFEDSINPHAGLSQSSVWTQVQNTVRQTVSKHAGNAAAGSTDAWRTSNHNLRFQLPDPGYGGKMYISFWRRVTYTVTAPQNWKWLRVWRTAPSSYPNWYIATQVDGSRIKYSENCAPDANNRQYGAYPQPTSAWRFEEYLLKLPSGVGQANGQYKIRINGQPIHEFSTWKIDCSGTPGTIKDVNIQDDPSNFVPAAGTEVFKDDVVIDRGWSRVYIGNAPTYAASTHLEYQPAYAWSDSSITVTQKHGTFPSGSTKYLFVCNNNDECSNGVLLQ